MFLVGERNGGFLRFSHVFWCWVAKYLIDAKKSAFARMADFRRFRGVKAEKI